ncbi:hypothetical protein SDC9_89487 [bioreactor metagenome]|uniref:Uncharacterized protein n=1 Tax=bioreactor metagenome TaxID=1076179 RepID=A0A644ZPY4_9ZZZZ
MQFDTLFVTLICKLFYDITLKRGAVNNVIGRLLGIEHRKTIVMARSDTNVFCAGSLHIGNPFFSVVF